MTFGGYFYELLWSSNLWILWFKKFVMSKMTAQNLWVFVVLVTNFRGVYEFCGLLVWEFLVFLFGNFCYPIYKFFWCSNTRYFVMEYKFLWLKILKIDTVPHVLIGNNSDQLQHPIIVYQLNSVRFIFFNKTDRTKPNHTHHECWLIFFSMSPTMDCLIAYLGWDNPFFFFF